MQQGDRTGDQEDYLCLRFGPSSDLLQNLFLVQHSVDFRIISLLQTAQVFKRFSFVSANW